MKQRILENGNLEITITCKEQRELKRLRREDPDNFDSDIFMHDWVIGDGLDVVFKGKRVFLEDTRPEFCGALTDAPMLAIYGPDRPMKEGEDPVFCNVVERGEDGVNMVQDPVECWAFMNYMIISVQRELLENRRCVWQIGELEHG